MKQKRSGLFYVMLGTLGLAATATISMAQEAVVRSESTMIRACGDLFAIDSNAANLTAAQRAQIVQQRLDAALIAAKDRMPGAVGVTILNNNPVVTLDNCLIVTADANSAARARMSQMELAHRWADTIRACLAQTEDVNKYVAMLTGQFEHKAVVSKAYSGEEVAVAPREMLFPITLVTPVITETAMLGDLVEGVISHDVPLPPHFNTFIPAGSRVFGELIDANLHVPNKLAGADGLSIEFNEIKLPDGKKIPISAHVFGGVDEWHIVKTKPTTAEHMNNSTTVQDNAALVTLNQKPMNGVVTGGWRSIPDDRETQSSFRRLVMHRRPCYTIPCGEPMLLQLSGTTAISVAKQATL